MRRKAVFAMLMLLFCWDVHHILFYIQPVSAKKTTSPIQKFFFIRANQSTYEINDGSDAPLIAFSDIKFAKLLFSLTRSC